MRHLTIGIALLASAASAAAMPVSTFTQKATSLKAMGPLALLSSDYRLLKGEIVASMSALRTERLGAIKSGMKPAYCPTQQSGAMTLEEVLGVMNAVPTEQRAHTDVKDALRAHLAQRFPCTR